MLVVLSIETITENRFTRFLRIPATFREYEPRFRIELFKVYLCYLDC